MIGFAVRFSLDRRPAEPDRSLLDGLAHRPAEHRLVVAVGGCALAVAQRFTSGREATAPQPFLAGQDVVVVFDGYLNEPARLAAELRVAPDAAEVALVAAAYRNWGVGCVERLGGEWSLAIFDGGRHRLVLARDQVGNRPLVWARDGNELVVGSEVGQVARLRPGSPRLNEGMAAEFLVGRPTSPTETLVQGVERLPPASVLVAEDGSVRVRRYWDLDFGVRIGRGALDQVRAAVSVAVGRRLEHCGSVGAEVSGGLDSSLVAGVAARVGPVLPLVIDHGPGTRAYERPAWQAVTSQLGVEPVVVDGDEADIEVFATEAVRSLDVPLTPEAAGWCRLMGAAAERDVRVVLTGQWGDEWFRPTSAHLADALWHRSWKVAWDDSALWAEGPAARAWLLGRRAAVDLLRQRFPQTPGGVHRFPRYLRPEFAARVHLRDRLSPLSVTRDLGPAPRCLYGHLHLGGAQWGAEASARMAAGRGLELRHPLADVDLIELMVRLPERARGWAGGERPLQRELVRELFSDQVADRADKADFGSQASRQLLASTAAEGGLAASLAGRFPDWFDLAGLTQAESEVADGTASGFALLGLWSGIALGKW